MYLRLLAEAEDIFAQSRPSPEHIEGVIGQMHTYCTDDRLTVRLVEWRGAIQAAAFDHTLKHRRYRDLASSLRSIDDPLRRYIERLQALQAEGNPKAPTHDQQWDLRTVLGLLERVAAQLAQTGQVGEVLLDVREACEETIRNYNKALSLVLAQLIGHARQDLAIDRL
jgi:hypothetical protein